ncbi:MAG: alanine dehydrogenase [Burkholderiales bacterium 70-64]|nr:MAG: alanine dehydrogenase [Burkholderiales bacterium 70-64]
MKVGVPKEIKTHEYRVGLTPESVREYVAHGHTVLVETQAGAAIGADDAAYRRAGAVVVPDARAVFEGAELIVKVKEPQPAELAMLRPHHLLFTYLHLAPDARQADALLASGCAAIAYETVMEADGSLPLLAPMSEVAGRMSVAIAGHLLMRHAGGAGILLGGAVGVAPARVLVLGAGVAGSQAARMAAGAGAQVTVVNRGLARLRALEALMPGRIRTRPSTRDAIEHEIARADVVIGAALVAGAGTPKLVTRAMLGTMKPRSLIIDISIDQGGCCETSRPTTHAEPTYEVDDIVHYCVANMPGAVPRTSSQALNLATLPYGLALADRGLDALRKSAALRTGLNVLAGRITHPEVAAALGRTFVDPSQALAQHTTRNV